MGYRDMKLRLLIFASLSTLFLAPFSGNAEIYESWDFESGETYTAHSLEPNAKIIELVPNHRLEEWTISGGKGIVEGNLVPAADTFQYDSREGNVLNGVTGIRKPHVANVDIRAGNLYDWNKGYKNVASPGWERVEVTSKHALCGNYSLCFATSDTISYLGFRFPPEKSAYCIRFLIRFSPEAFHPKGVYLPLSFMLLRKNSIQRLTLKQKEPGGSAFLTLEPHDDATVLREERSQRVTPIIAGTTYELGYHVVLHDSNTAETAVLVDGKEQLRQIARYVHRTPIVSHGFSLGRVGKNIAPGPFFVDELFTGDTILPTCPARPEISLKDSFLIGSAFLDKGAMHQASHWQIAKNNSWLIPVFNSGRETKKLGRLPIPYRIELRDRVNDIDTLDSPQYIHTGIQADSEYLARVRHQNGAGRWSDWSSPLQFRTPSPSLSIPEPGRHSPTVRKAFFTDPGRRKALTRIIKGKWYDLNVQITDSKGSGNLEYADLYLCADPPNCRANHRNRGGAFDERENYTISVSVTDHITYAKYSSGWVLAETMSRMNSFYCGNAKMLPTKRKDEFRFRVKARLLNSARCGPWLIAGYAKNRQNRFSGMYGSIVHVVDEMDMSGMGSVGRIAVTVAVLVVIGLALGVVWTSKKRKVSPVPFSQGATPTDEQPVLPAVGGEASERIRRAMKYILDNHAKQISTKEVAQSVNLSSKYFGKAFVKETGITVGNYLNQVRVEEAQNLLKQTDLSVTEIASRVGFNSLFHFSYVFRSLQNMSPRDFRKNR